ncbi:MAG: MarR family winged helix-turn-helix transcriptional regulator [Hyphomicrobiaceae bacterium]
MHQDRLNPRLVLMDLSDVAHAMRTYIDQRARTHGMTRAQWAVLVRLDRVEGQMQAELAEALEIQPISLARLVDRLCDQELVERRPHPTDRRANLLYLTAQGRKVLERMAPLGEEVSSEVLASFTRNDVAALYRALQQIKDNIRHALEKHGAGAETGKVRNVR